jgi:hypothetical protein
VATRKVDEIPLPGSAGQGIGHMAASFVGTLIVLLIQFGVPITPEQQSAILSVIIVGWTFGSSLYAIWHNNRVAKAARQRATR